MGTIPSFLLREQVAVRAWLGPGQYAPSATYRAHVQETRKLLRNSAGDIAACAELRTWLRLGVDVPIGSQATVRGRVATAVHVDVHDSRGLPTPDHVDVWWELAEFTATTTVTVRRRAGGGGVDVFGDPVDGWNVVVSSVAAAFAEDRQQTYESQEMRRGVVETWSVRLRADAPVLEGDQLTDAAGAVFVVTAVARQVAGIGSGLGVNDTRVSVRRVGAASQLPTG